ncbi:hypothetical protein R84981_001709 [Carnimonas sp. R-84981]|uniref:phage protein Gp37 n=1 Tax=Carnimonas bestiolae TaxID=3402172 RepID=UPI003EDC9E88
MLGELEDRLITRLQPIKERLKRLQIESYGGELNDPDMIASLIRRAPGLLVVMPQANFRRASAYRYSLTMPFRIVIVARSARNERSTRRGTDYSVGSYELWNAVLTQLAGWQPWPDGARIEPTELNNLVNGSYQNDMLSVLGQSFQITKDWCLPDGLDDDGIDLPPIDGIDLHYHTPPDAVYPVANDRVDLGDSNE